MSTSGKSAQPILAFLTPGETPLGLYIPPGVTKLLPILAFHLLKPQQSREVYSTTARGERALEHSSQEGDRSQLGETFIGREHTRIKGERKEGHPA